MHDDAFVTGIDLVAAHISGIRSSCLMPSEWEWFQVIFNLGRPRIECWQFSGYRLSKWMYYSQYTSNADPAKR